MAANHDVVAAMPAASASVKALLRTMLAKRMVFALADSEDSRDFKFADPDYAVQTLALSFQGNLYDYDATDTTTAHDGITCLLSGDAAPARYKLSDFNKPYSVLDKDLTAPPGSPAIGDAYLIYGSPTGAWAGHADAITVYTARGWEFATGPIGFQVYIEDEDAYYHRDDAGDWMPGVGTIVVSDDSVPASAFINAGLYFVVENQTTNTPPVSPSVGDAYIIGSSPTGAWSGKAAKLAVCEASGAWTYYTPAEGWAAYDRALNLRVNYSGSVWATESLGYASALVAERFIGTAISWAGTDDAGYAYNVVIPPTSTQNRIATETLTLPITADFAGQLIEIEYEAQIDAISATAGGSLSDMTIGVFIDSEVNARDWRRVNKDGSWNTTLNDIRALFQIRLADTSAHTIKIIIFPRGSASITGGSITLARRKLVGRRKASTTVPQGSELPVWLGTVIGDMTGGGGRAAAFDGNTGQAATACARLASTTSGYVGLLLGLASTISSVIAYGSNDQGYVSASNPSTTIQLYGKQGTAPSSSTDGTLLGSSTFTDTADESGGKSIASSDTSTIWDYVWIRVSTASSSTLNVAELRFFS